MPVSLIDISIELAYSSLHWVVLYWSCETRLLYNKMSFLPSSDSILHVQLYEESKEARSDTAVARILTQVTFAAQNRGRLRHIISSSTKSEFPFAVLVEWDWFGFGTQAIRVAQFRHIDRWRRNLMRTIVVKYNDCKNIYYDYGTIWAVSWFLSLVVNQIHRGADGCNSSGSASNSCRHTWWRCSYSTCIINSCLIIFGDYEGGGRESCAIVWTLIFHLKIFRGFTYMSQAHCYA
jgi:hypothetical protein